MAKSAEDKAHAATQNVAHEAVETERQMQIALQHSELAHREAEAQRARPEEARSTLTHS